MGIALEGAGAPALVTTYYYYWYDAPSGTHMTDGWGLDLHLPTGATDPLVSWSNPDWHRRQLEDMAYAGIDIVLPVYWGFDRLGCEWSPAGLGPLQEARDSILTAGGQAPPIALFLDTTIVDCRDLRIAGNIEWFWSQIEAFYAAVDPQHWARVFGMPVIQLFSSQYTQAFGQSLFDTVYQRFQTRFGVRPLIVAEMSWNPAVTGWQNDQPIREPSQPTHTDATYQWCGWNPTMFVGQVAEITPGYDDRLVPGRGAGHYVDRAGGLTYVRNWEAAIASGKRVVAVETWNEIHEATAICETVEYGRDYIELTRQMVTAFKAARA